MLLSTTRPAAASVAGPRGASRCLPFSRSANLSVRAMQEGSVGDAASQGRYDAGRRLQPWLASPFDLLSFGPRAGTGALLSLPERLQRLEYDVARARELAQDPRPLEEKSEELLKELEDTMLEFLEKGATVEQDVLANLKAALPQEAASFLSQLIPTPPLRERQGSGTTATTATEAQPMSRYGQDDVMADQVASEISEIRNAVSSLKMSLDAMRTNTEPADAKIMMINLKEARDQLERRLAEIAPATATDPSIAAAEREARILLGEVDSMFFSS